MKTAISKVLVGLALSSTLSSSVALASGEMQNAMSPMQKAVEKSNYFVKADSIYFLLKGFSVGAGMNIGKNASVEVDYQKYEFNGLLFDSIKHKFSAVVVRGDYWFYQPIEERGFYVSAGLNSVSVESKVKDSYYGDLDAKDSKTGGQVILGYQIDFLAGTNDILRTKFGLGSGNGSAVRSSNYYNKTEIESGLFFEASAAYNF